MMRKVFISTLYIVLALFLSIFILLTSTELVAFDMSFYKKEFEKYNIARNIGIVEKDLIDSTENLLDYLKNKRDNLDFKTTIKGQKEEFFSPRDKLHMIDVKYLFVLGRKIRNYIFLTMLFLIPLFMYKKVKLKISNLLLSTAAVGVLPIIVLIILMNVDFNKYFTIFHEIFFNNDLWLLDPNVDRLVNIFPENFFYDIAIRIITYYLTTQAVLLILGLAFKYKKSLQK
ncbi:MAG: TIGR01906 family membrane protein [Clostridiales bacterium]|nr:TIGR01906 family membrane protein [Clostridiales bacterium]